MFYPLHTDIRKPQKFTYPFCYEPHELCLTAAHEVQLLIASHGEWRADADKGKMFGVLVVETAEGQLGYLAAYSGLLAGRNDWQCFVPPVFDSQQPDGYFKCQEAEISAINVEVKALETDAAYSDCRRRRTELEREASDEIAAFKARMVEAKRRRDAARACNAEVADMDMIRESQFMKAELRRIKKRWQEQLDIVEKECGEYECRLRLLKDRRKAMSDALQVWLFSQYDMLNARGERRNLLSIFEDTPQKTPPAGSGDCCAPKLLQYAYIKGMRPVCMAEFWWGASPAGEIRHHLQFYPSCTGKCKPILAHMLKGLCVEDDPRQTADAGELKVVYDDEWIAVVLKPAGMLSVPGKGDRQSVLSIVNDLYPGISGPVIVHRLDMDTSGLMVVAKTKEVYCRLQEMFCTREVKKRYVALLDGIVSCEQEGTIELPLCADIMHRPMQKVDYDNGKQAVTYYKLLKSTEQGTLVSMSPLTGRTHQLRVHCAHKDGLGMPIKGDALYGTSSSRLFLHAEALEFVHPVTGKHMLFESRCDFS